MDEGDIPWKGVPSASDAWPFALDIAKFEARRAVGQMARNLLGIYGHYAATHETPPANITLLYARAAKYHSEMTNQVLKELVAEARAGELVGPKSGRPWTLGQPPHRNDSERV